jgi:putative flippase GtrA
MFRLSREKTLFLLIGGWNTLFGIVLYAVALRLLSGFANYVVILIMVQVIALTQAFLLYRSLVFVHHSGNRLMSYVRFCAVSTLNAALGALVVWLLVGHLGWHPALANVLATVVVVIANYFGHKYVSFSGGMPA